MLLLLLVSCVSTTESTDTQTPPVEKDSGDDIQEFVFDDPEESVGDEGSGADVRDGHEGAAFIIYLSSDWYRVEQLHHDDTLRVRTDSSYEQRAMHKLVPYNRKRLVRRVRLLVSLEPSSGKVRGYRIVGSSYVREFDSLVMEDIARLRFHAIGKCSPDVVYVLYEIQLFNRRSSAGDGPADR